MLDAPGTPRLHGPGRATVAHRLDPGAGERQLSAYEPSYPYKLATPNDGYLQPYGDYFEIDIDAAGRTHALWGEGNSYVGPGNVWYARQE